MDREGSLVNNSHSGDDMLVTGIARVGYVELWKRRREENVKLIFLLFDIFLYFAL
jgi:hypothetical protein